MLRIVIIRTTLLYFRQYQNHNAFQSIHLLGCYYIPLLFRTVPLFRTTRCVYQHYYTIYPPKQKYVDYNELHTKHLYRIHYKSTTSFSIDSVFGVVGYIFSTWLGLTIDIIAIEFTSSHCSLHQKLYHYQYVTLLSFLDIIQYHRSVLDMSPTKRLEYSPVFTHNLFITILYPFFALSNTTIVGANFTYHIFFYHHSLLWTTSCVHLITYLVVYQYVQSFTLIVSNIVIRYDIYKQL